MIRCLVSYLVLAWCFLCCVCIGLFGLVVCFNLIELL